MLITSFMTGNACTSVWNQIQSILSSCEYNENILEERWIHINIKTYDIEVQAPKALLILYKLFLQIVVQFYRFILACSYRSSFLSTTTRFAKKWGANQSVIAANIFCTDSHLNHASISFDVSCSDHKRNDTTSV